MDGDFAGARFIILELVIAVAVVDVEHRHRRSVAALCLNVSNGQLADFLQTCAAMGGDGDDPRQRGLRRVLAWIDVARAEGVDQYADLVVREAVTLRPLELAALPVKWIVLILWEASAPSRAFDYRLQGHRILILGLIFTLEAGQEARSRLARDRGQRQIGELIDKGLHAPMVPLDGVGPDLCGFIALEFGEPSVKRLRDGFARWGWGCRAGKFSERGNGDSASLSRAGFHALAEYVHPPPVLLPENPFGHIAPRCRPPFDARPFQDFGNVVGNTFEASRALGPFGGFLFCRGRAVPLGAAQSFLPQKVFAGLLPNARQGIANVEGHDCLDLIGGELLPLAHTLKQ